MPKKLYDKILVIDVESTCWDGKPPRNQKSDIIEIGLCVVDYKTLEPEEKHSFFVRPERSTISEFCTELTTITPKQVAGAPSLETVCGYLEKDFKSRSRIWASYGDYDRTQFERCCRDQRINYPFGKTHMNVKSLFGVSRGSRPVGMAKALNILGEDLEGTHHRGDDDAWNIAKILRRVMKGS